MNVVQEIQPMVSNPQVGKKENHDLRVSSSVDIDVFPNPADDWLQVSFPILENEGTITMYNSSGKVILQSIISGNTDLNKVNIQHLPSGIYFVQVQSDKIQGTQKVIIQ